MRRRALLVLPLLLLAAASGPAASPVETLDKKLERVRAEAEAAERRAQRLQDAAAAAGSEAARLRGEREAAAAAIESAEAAITAADTALSRARGQAALVQARLDARRAPVAALLSGLVTMTRRPPLLVLADGASLEELVRVRLLLDSTMPEIARRSAALAAEVQRSRHSLAEAAKARDERAEALQLLDTRRMAFAELERTAALRAADLSSEAFTAEEQVLASGEALRDVGGAARAAATARANAQRLAQLPFAPPRPVAGIAAPTGPRLAYRLPADATVIEGLGTVSPVGVRSRGIRLATARGAALFVPADGTVLFAGPYRDHDGVVILDHGQGWTSLLLAVSTELDRGQRVRRGAPLGRALGPITVELRHRGTAVSPALIAGSSGLLSNRNETR